jgi:DNA-binding NtrC family response regulator
MSDTTHGSLFPRAQDRFRQHVVACVEDDAETLGTLRRLLRDAPYRVLITDRPYEALEWLETNRISLVVSDHRLRDMPGVQLLEEVRRRSPDTVRLILTSNPESREVVDALGKTVQGVIAKPWDGASLKRTILAILQCQEERHHAPGAR